MRKALAGITLALSFILATLVAAPAQATHLWPTYATVHTNLGEFRETRITYYEIKIRAHDWTGRSVKGHASLWVNGKFERRRELIWGWRGFRIDRGDLPNDQRSRIQIRIDPSSERRQLKTVTRYVTDRSSKAARIIAAARAQVGDRYQWGADGPNTYDCSGLVKYAYATIGIRLPHQSALQARSSRQVSTPQPGDLVYIPGHIAIYAGNGRVIEATPPRVRDVRMWQRGAKYIRILG